MNGGGGAKAGNNRGSIPSNVRKMIQSIKEIAGSHSEEDIHAMLKECFIDPNVTAQKLLLQDSFHEVRRKHERKKENQTKDPAGPRWKPGMQGRGNRGGQGSHPFRNMSYDTADGRNSSAKDNTPNQDFEKAVKQLVREQVSVSTDTSKSISAEDNPVMGGRRKRQKMQAEGKKRELVDDDRCRLDERLARLGMVEEQIIGDGNCQFRALAEQLFQNQDKREYVRRMVIDQLINSGGGAKAWNRDSIPIIVRKTIQNIMEITGGHHSEEDIHAMLKDCSIIPNETAQKLLPQDSFHEDRRKHERKKEIQTKDPAGPRWKPGMQGRGYRGGQGSHPSRNMSYDTADGRNSSAKDNTPNQDLDKAVKQLVPEQVSSNTHTSKSIAAEDNPVMGGRCKRQKKQAKGKKREPVDDDRCRLDERLARLGMVEEQIIGDGNCQFRALVEQLFQNQDKHGYVRRKVIKQLKGSRDSYAGFVSEEYEDFLERMQSGEWGEHVTLQAAADFFKVEIILVTSHEKNWYLKISPWGDNPPSKVIWLSLLGQVHYSSLNVDDDSGDNPVMGGRCKGQKKQAEGKKREPLNDDRRRLDERLATCGLVVKQITGDGNCQLVKDLFVTRSRKEKSESDRNGDLVCVDGRELDVELRSEMEECKMMADAESDVGNTFAKRGSFSFKFAITFSHAEFQSRCSREKNIEKYGRKRKKSC